MKKITIVLIDIFFEKKKKTKRKKKRNKIKEYYNYIIIFYYCILIYKGVVYGLHGLYKWVKLIRIPVLF